MFFAFVSFVTNIYIGTKIFAYHGYKHYKRIKKESFYSRIMSLNVLSNELIKWINLRITAFSRGRNISYIV